MSTYKKNSTRKETLHHDFWRFRFRIESTEKCKAWNEPEMGILVGLMTKHRSVHTVSRGMKGQAALITVPWTELTRMCVCEMRPCLTLHHDTFFSNLPFLSAPSCLWNLVCTPNTCRHACSGCAVHRPNCTHKIGYTPLMHSPVACDTSRWNVKEPQSSLSAALGKDWYFCLSQTLYSFTHSIALYTLFSLSLKEEFILIALPFVDCVL